MWGGAPYFQHSRFSFLDIVLWFYTRYLLSVVVLRKIRTTAAKVANTAISAG